MNRRTLLRTSAAALGGGAAAVAGLRVASDAAGAETALTLDVAGDSASLGADESVRAVRLDVDVEWAYELADSASPSEVLIELAAAAGDNEPETVAEAESAELFTESDGTEAFDVDLIDEGVLTADELTPDGGAQDTTVTVEARLLVENSDDDALARETATDEATLSVETGLNASEYGAVGGDGTLTIETE